MERAMNEDHFADVEARDMTRGCDKTSCIPSLWLGLLLAWAPTVAMAQARVMVSLVDGAGRPVDGTVTLTGPASASCRTTAGRCTLSAQAGNYRASASPTRGTPPPPRMLNVPSAGNVSLVLRVGDAAPSATVRPAIVRPGVIQPAAPRTTTTRPGTQATVRPATVSPRPVYASPAPRTNVARAPVAAGRPAPTVQTSPPRTTVQAGAVVRPGTAVASPGSAQPVSPFLTPAQATPQTAPAGSVGRNLGQGSHLCAQGQVLDSAGRPLDATLRFESGGRVVGDVRSTAGRFSLFDLPPGTYSVNIMPTRGAATRANVNLPAGVARLVFRVP